MTDPKPPVVRVKGAALDAPWISALELIEADHAVSTSSRLELQFRDDDLFTLSSGETAPRLGDAIEVEVAALDAAGTEKMITAFEGVITGVGIEWPDGGHPFFRVEALDKSYKLSYGSPASAFSDMEVKNVLATTVSDVGLTLEADNVPTIQVEGQMRYGTRRELLDALTRQLGLVWWTRKDRLHVDTMGSGPKGPSLRFGRHIRSFNLGVDGRMPAGATSRTMLPSEQKPVSVDVPRPRVSAGALVDQASKSTLNGENRELRGAVVAPTAQAMTVAAEGALRAEQERNVRLRAVTEHWDASRPPVSFTVEGAGPAAGTYVATRVVHRFRSDEGLLTTVEAGSWESASLTELLRPIPAEVPRQHLAIAEVTNVNDETKARRVKVRYPGIDEAVEANWARVVIPGGGKERGVAFYPTMGDIVLVGFEDGNINLPIVLGGLVGTSHNTGPEVRIGQEVPARVIQSDTGSHLTFQDKDEGKYKQGVTLQALGSNITTRKIEMDKEGILVTSDKRVQFKVDQSELTLDPDGTITLKGQKVIVEGVQQVSIASKQNVEIKGDIGVKANGAKGQSKLDLGLGGAELSAGAMTTVKGAVVNIN